MEWVTVRARTVEAAVEQALDMLGVHDTELEYEVVVEPKKGVLGIGRTDATIRARIKPMSREKPNDRRRRGRNERKPKGEGGQKPKSDGQQKAESTPKQAQQQPAKAAAKAANGVESGAGASEGGSNRSRNRRRGGGGGQRAAADGAGAAVAQDVAPETNSDTTPTSTPAERKPRPEREAPAMTTGSVAEQLDAARTFAEGFLDAFGVEGTVAVTNVDDEAIEVSITGQNLGLLLGPQGVTLQAIEEILRGSVGHRGPARIHLDIAGYRARRKAALADFARSVAQEVLATGSAKALEPMGSADRKVVHDTVAELEGVTTISDGEDARRRVVIKPA